MTEHKDPYDLNDPQLPWFSIAMFVIILAIGLVDYLP